MLVLIINMIKCYCHIILVAMITGLNIAINVIIMMDAAEQGFLPPPPAPLTARDEPAVVVLGEGQLVLLLVGRLCLGHLGLLPPAPDAQEALGRRRHGGEVVAARAEEDQT